MAMMLIKVSAPIVSPASLYPRSSLTSAVLEFGQIIKKSVEKEGMLGWQYSPIGVSDAITMGSEGWFLIFSLL
jgi:dihydroxy-acid dehydratase